MRTFKPNNEVKPTDVNQAPEAKQTSQAKRSSKKKTKAKRSTKKPSNPRDGVTELSDTSRYWMQGLVNRTWDMHVVDRFPRFEERPDGGVWWIINPDETVADFVGVSFPAEDTHRWQAAGEKIQCLHINTICHYIAQGKIAIRKPFDGFAAGFMEWIYRTPDAGAINYLIDNHIYSMTPRAYQMCLVYICEKLGLTIEGMEVKENKKLLSVDPLWKMGTALLLGGEDNPQTLNGLWWKIVHRIQDPAVRFFWSQQVRLRKLDGQFQTIALQLADPKLQMRLDADLKVVLPLLTEELGYRPDIRAFVDTHDHLGHRDFGAMDQSWKEAHASMNELEEFELAVEMMTRMFHGSAIESEDN